MGWLILAFVVVLICVIKWSLEPLKECERVEMGYRCKGLKCECNNDKGATDNGKDKTV